MSRCRVYEKKAKEVKDRDKAMTAMREYFEESGVFAGIHSAVMALYQEDPWPRCPIKFICDQLATMCISPVDPLAELVKAREKIEKLQRENAEIRKYYMNLIQEKDSP